MQNYIFFAIIKNEFTRELLCFWSNDDKHANFKSFICRVFFVKNIFSYILSAFTISNLFLKGNKLRSFLSVLGIAIGIFCIVSVLTFAGSMKNNVRGNLETLGLNVIVIEKWPWGFGGGEYKWWDFMSRPQVSLREYKLLNQRFSKDIVKDLGFESSTRNTLIKYGKKSTNKSLLIGTTSKYSQMNGLVIRSGRMFSENEEKSSKNMAVLGDRVATELFGDENPVGKTFKINGLRCTVIGIFEKQGSFLNKQLDMAVFIPYTFMKNFADFSSESSQCKIVVRGFQNRSIEELEAEITKQMRNLRMLKPKQKDNFALNKMTMLSQQLDSTFKMLDMVAWILGLFSLIVGMFGIANILFVSVKERTPFIGIQKALGAKKNFILVQFLYESVLLSLFGGIAGIILVWFTTIAVSKSFDFPVFFSINNFLTGIILSTITGLIAGIIPAMRASKLNPVDAIRSA